MNGVEYQEAALRTKNTVYYKIDNEDLVHGIQGIATEAGELLDLVKKYHAYGKEFSREKIIDETGDVLWYVALLLKSVGSTFDEAMTRNITKLRTRFPDKFSEELAINKDVAKEIKVMFSDDEMEAERVRKWALEFSRRPIEDEPDLFSPRNEE